MASTIKDAFNAALERHQMNEQRRISDILTEWASDDEAHRDTPTITNASANQPQEAPMGFDPQPHDAAPPPEAAANTAQPLHGNTTTEKVFYFVRDSGKINRTLAGYKLVNDHGLARGTVYSLISQMIANGVFDLDEDNNMSTNFKEYRPLPNGKNRKRMSAINKDGRKTRVGTAAPARLPKVKPKVVDIDAAHKLAKPVPPGKPEEVERVIAEVEQRANNPTAHLNHADIRKMTAKDLLETLSVMQAKALYDELTKIF